MIGEAAPGEALCESLELAIIDIRCLITCMTSICRYWATQCLDDAGYFREILEKLANQKISSLREEERHDKYIVN